MPLIGVRISGKWMCLPSGVCGAAIGNRPVANDATPTTIPYRLIAQWCAIRVRVASGWLLVVRCLPSAASWQHQTLIFHVVRVCYRILNFCLDYVHKSSMENCVYQVPSQIWKAIRGYYLAIWRSVCLTLAIN